ncbi:RNA polymerase recycling motor HelD [Brevibacillus sp. SYSU BS000544]|uniref:RNA polymerase recycling motor HelD n=1 Tax=Brevibacillus sp. SYSU BS000544 TaxID=3416443 RepID=UPI003CE5645F
MSSLNPDWQKEQGRVDSVIKQINNRIVTLQKDVGELQANIVEIRKNFWDDVTVNFEDAYEAIETYASIKQQAEVLSERERGHRHAEKQLKTMLRLHHSPYFGRIDFHENGLKQEESIYIGLASLLDQNEEQFLIYDWRAPVASMYYDYSPGPAEYVTPGGTITGNIELKRQYMIRNGKIHSLFDTGVTIGDELLQEVLGKQSSTQMKSIVATIQKEQNRIIRNERSRLLIVQGPAGSGKTSAALQRVAYLLYRYRETLRADQIVLFSPNPMFNSYVSTVLPELGEENMQQTTFQEYLERRIGDAFQLDDPFSQLEYVHTAMQEPDYSTRLEGIRWKATIDFMNLLDCYIDSLIEKGIIFRDITFRGRTILTAEQINEQFYSLDPSLRIPNRISLLVRWALNHLDTCAKTEVKKQWVEEEVQFLDKDDFREVYQELRKRKRFGGDTFDDFSLEQQLLSALVVKRHFEPLRNSVKHLKFIDLPAIYRQLFTREEGSFLIPDGATFTLPSTWKDICKQTLSRLDQSELAYEDATPFLYVKERIEGFRTNNVVRHVFIDEAQDYSPLQLAFLKRLFPNSKMTVLGDINQAIHAQAAAELTEFTALYETEQTELIILTRSYRSTKPIVEFTSRILAGKYEIEPFNRDGKKPTVTQATDAQELADRIKERILTLQKDGHRTIAIIGKTALECQEAYQSLQDKIQARLIHKEMSSFEAGILIIPSYLAKGMEFDAVIIYNASKEQYGQESDRKLLYTVCTRAMHELHVYHLGERSPLLESHPQETYISEQ